MQVNDFNVARRRLVRCGLAGALGVGLLSLGACSKDAASFHASNITGAEIGKNWSLPDVDGTVRTAADFSGKVTVVFFGFVTCPDVCPTALAELAQVRERLGDDADKLQVLFVTVDPERDTPEIVSAYLEQFDPSFIGLRGDAEQLAAAAKAFKVFYAKVPMGDAGNYTMDHSAGLYLFDPKGEIRLYARGDMTPDQLASDIRHLMA